MAGKNPQNPCPVPDCNQNIGVRSVYPVCHHHDDIMKTMTFYLKKMNEQADSARRKGVRPGENVSPSGIILPPGVKG